MKPGDFKPPPPGPASEGYVFNEALVRAVRVAFATRRPLLLRGDPGSGKTTLARAVAKELGWVYYQQVVTSRTEARDLEWRFDAVRRLADAHLGASEGSSIGHYVDPAVLWWAFDPASASHRGNYAGGRALLEDPGETFGRATTTDTPAVVLIDEIDKAEPEVANDLLEPFDVQRFTVAETGVRVEYRRKVFLIVTTNEERDLPGAFLRRCVVHEITRPLDEAAFAAIARSHFGDTTVMGMVPAFVERFRELAGEARALRVRAPGVAEFLDAMRACGELGVTPQSPDWEVITRLALWKHRRVDDEQGDH